MFDTLLIANRGEIAARVIRSARAMGLRTVAVYSEADRDALHVVLADDAVCIGGAAPGESYLRGDRIIEAALATGAGAIHPGYGFLSENPDFVEAVAAAGLVFVGPSADAIRAMGLKDAAKAAMEAAGVPVVPGYHGSNQEPARLEVEAAGIGYPVMIKAVAGGGGKGMRIVETPEAFIDALESCKAEARTAFGNDAVLIEKFIQSPRHIELQVFGDSHGNVIHLGERDCSLQRRHQKVIEEAPAPGMTQDVRAVMGAAACKAAAAIKYVGAGTVEFIVDGAGPPRADGFWFMEMNTRLQVEHPVTEAITGQDLVEWQLRVAMGEALPLRQEEVTLTGHAVEARLYAEDPATGFLPSTGRLHHLRFSDALRVDSGVRAGDRVSPHYDPMVAKLIAHGPNRSTAIEKLRAGLAGTQVIGPATNRDFLHGLAGDAGFMAGDVDTGLIARRGDALVASPAPQVSDWAAAIIAAAGLWEEGLWEQGFALWDRPFQAVTLARDGAEIRCRYRALGPACIEIDTPDGPVLAQRDGSFWHIDGQRLPPATVAGGQVAVFGPAAQRWDIPDPLARAGADAAPKGAALAPMPGVVRAVLVIAGQVVQAGDRLAVLEAMKMEHSLTASHDAIVAEILVTEGAQVEAGTALVRLEEKESAT